MVEQSSQPSQNQSKFKFLFPWLKTPTPKPPITPNEPKPIVTIIPILSFEHHTQDVSTPLSPSDATAQPPPQTSLQQEKNQTVSQPPSEQNSSTSQSEPRHNEDQDQPPSTKPLTQDHQVQVESSPRPLLEPQNESQTQVLNAVMTKSSQESDPVAEGASVSQPTNIIIPSRLLQDLPESTLSLPSPSLDMPGTKSQPFSEPNTAHWSKIDSQPTLPPHIEKQPQQASQEVSKSPSATYANIQPSQPPSPRTSQLQLPQPFTQSAQTSEPQSMPQNLPLPIGSAHSQFHESSHPRSTEAQHSLPSDAMLDPQLQLQPQLAIQPQPESREAWPATPSKTIPQLHPIRSSKHSSPPSQPAESQPTVPHYSSQSIQPSKVFNSMEERPHASIVSPVHSNPIDTTQSYTKQETEPREEERPQIQTDEKTKQKISTELHMEPQPNQQIKPHSVITSSAEPKNWKKQKIGDEETETRGTTGFKFSPTASRHDQTTTSASHTKFSVSIGELDSLYKEMKEDLSGLVHKLVMGQTNQQLDAPSSAMALVGKSKGAIMHITLDMEENGGLSNTDENPGQPTCINSNTQTVNNSILCNSSLQERNPGAHLAFPFTE